MGLSCSITYPLQLSSSVLITVRITSRKYHNFTNDAQRRGDTVKPFNDRQAWNLLMKLLGPEWEELDRKGLIKGSEESAAKELLRSLGGVWFPSRPRDIVSFKLIMYSACSRCSTSCTAYQEYPHWWAHDRFNTRVVQRSSSEATT